MRTAWMCLALGSALLAGRLLDWPLFAAAVAVCLGLAVLGALRCVVRSETQRVNAALDLVLPPDRAVRR